MNQIVELSTSEIEQVSGAGVPIFIINFILAEAGFFAWVNSKIADLFE